MRILIISSSPLKREISVGATYLNLFDNLEDIELASICTRAGNPEPPISKSFCITEKMLIKNLLQKTPTGAAVEVKQGGQETLVHQENRAIKFVKRYRWTIFFWMQDFVWKLGRWKSPELEKFVEEYNPDIILTALLNSVCLNNLILYILSLSSAKFMLYAWDNNYSLRQFTFSPLRWIKRFIDRASMRKIVRKADLFYVISEIQKEDYEKCFRKECKVLTKGADFTEPPELKKQYHDPMQIVFTGNIGLNRWKSLKMIADVLENINKDRIKAQLRIYTATPLTGKMKKALDRGESSRIMGSVPASEVPGIQKNADMLVHVEALDLANKLRVRQSFSTKIVDYLKAARPILAVGPKSVASIDHLVRNECAIVADHKEELEQKLRAVLADHTLLETAAQNAYACGRRYHHKPDIQNMLIKDLEAACGKQ